MTEPFTETATCLHCGADLALMQFGINTVWGAPNATGHALACVGADAHEPVRWMAAESALDLFLDNRMIYFVSDGMKFLVVHAEETPSGACRFVFNGTAPSIHDPQTAVRVVRG